MAGGLLQSNAQTVSAWEFHIAKAVVDLPEGVKSRGPGGERMDFVYAYSDIPAKDDAGWQPAPVNKDGKITYGSSSSSRIPKEFYNKFTKVDFTYFRSFLDLTSLPANTPIEKLEFQIGHVDDQARMLVMNSKYKTPEAVPAVGGKTGGNNFVVDFSKHVVPGEVNTIFIIQVDDNPGGNTLTGGVEAKLNNQPVKAAVAPEPTVKTNPIRLSDKSTAVFLSGTVETNGAGQATATGLLISETAVNKDPLVDGPGVIKKDSPQKTAIDKVGTFIQPFTSELASGKTYSYRAFAVVNGKFYYSPVDTFTHK